MAQRQSTNNGKAATTATATGTGTRGKSQSKRNCDKCSKSFEGAGVRFQDGKLWCRDCAVCDGCNKALWNTQWAPWPDGCNYCMSCVDKKQNEMFAKMKM